MTEEDLNRVIENNVKRFDKNSTYVLFVNKGCFSHQSAEMLREGLRDKGIDLAVVAIAGEPYPNNIALYKLQKPETPE